MNNGDVEFIIGLLGKEFDSHDFIQKYLKHFPASYGQLLEKHDNTTTANAEIANWRIHDLSSIKKIERNDLE